MNLLLIFWGELLGTMLLVILGNGVVSNILYKRTKVINPGSLIINIAWGFAVMVGVLVAKSFTLDAGHLNPAVTIYFIVNGKITGIAFLVFIGSQLLGAAIGQIIVNFAYWNFANNIENKDVVLDCHANRPADQSKWIINIFAEFLATMILLAIITTLGTKTFSDDTLAPSSLITIVHTLIIACTIIVIGTSLGGQTGYSINPARDLMPRIVYQLTPFKNKTSANWSYSWVPVVAPLLAGSFIGAFSLLIK